MDHKRKFLGILTILTASVLMASCGNKTRSKVAPPTGSVGQSAATVGFQEVLDKVITNNCLECHNTYSQFAISSKLAPKMLDQMITGRMPKGGARLSQELIDIMQAWVASGTPLEAGGEKAKEIPLEPTFESLQVNFFAPKCLSCHSGDPNSPAPLHIDFSSYAKTLESNENAAISTGENLFNQESPEDSLLTFLLEDTGPGGQPMPPREVPGTPDYVSPGDATPEEIKVINEWMRRGYPEK